MSDDSNKVEVKQSMINDVKLMFESVLNCIDDEYISWLDYAQEVLNLAFSHHRYVITAGIVRKIEEPYRPIFLPEIMSVRKSVTFSFYIGKECVDLINEIIVFSEFLMNSLVSKSIYTRTVVGLAKLIAFIQRSISRDSSYLPPSTLKKLLNELYQHVLAALAVLRT